MKENKIEVWKDDKGVIHEKRDSYVLATAEINKERSISMIKKLLDLSENHPFALESYVYDIARGVIASGISLEELKKQYERKKSVYKEADSIKKKKMVKDYEGSSENNWNDNPGYDFGMGASDFGVPNC
jgi:hypothetical protein